MKPSFLTFTVVCCTITDASEFLSFNLKKSQTQNAILLLLASKSNKAHKMKTNEVIYRHHFFYLAAQWALGISVSFCVLAERLLCRLFVTAWAARLDDWLEVI